MITSQGGVTVADFGEWQSEVWYLGEGEPPTLVIMSPPLLGQRLKYQNFAGNAYLDYGGLRFHRVEPTGGVSVKHPLK